MKKIHLLLFTIIAAITAFTACDDNTDMIGESVVPDNDTITISTATYYATTKSTVAKDSILANAEQVYLGRFTDPETKTVFSSDFITQLNCVEDYGFPDEGVIGDSTLKVELRLFYNSFFGDSLNTMKCEVYELDRTLEEGTPYYTNIDPTEFYDQNKKAIGTATFSAFDQTIPDSVKLNDSYTPSITIPLPNEIGKRFIRKYFEKDTEGNHIGKEYFSNAEEFINNVFKGIYVKTTHGDGTLMYISMVRLNAYFDYYIYSNRGVRDSLVTGIATFSSTQEVLQVNKFQNKPGNNNTASTFEEFIANDDKCTYLKTPAGVFTEVELPITEIVENSDTLNSVKIAFTRYNQPNAIYPIPQNVLMVRKADMYDFFLNNKITDNKTSYISTFNVASNQYIFNNISRLITHCYNERKEQLGKDPEWENKNKDWNKVVLIPVRTTNDNMGNSISINHNLEITSVKLKGGTNDKIPVQVVTSKFSNE